MPLFIITRGEAPSHTTNQCPLARWTQTPRQPLPNGIAIWRSSFQFHLCDVEDDSDVEDAGAGDEGDDGDDDDEVKQETYECEVITNRENSKSKSIE